MTDAISPELALVDSTLRAAAIEMLPPVVALEFLQFQAPPPLADSIVADSAPPPIVLAALVYTVAAIVRSALVGLSVALLLVVLVSAAMLLK